MIVSYSKLKWTEEEIRKEQFINTSQREKGRKMIDTS